MTMRTYRYFKCENEHQGEEKTSENDQPYSKPWETVDTKGTQSRLTAVKAQQLKKGFTCLTVALICLRVMLV